LERTNEGRLEAKARGVKFGWKPTVDQKKVKALNEKGRSAMAIAQEMNIGKSTIYKELK
jgi:DNA invertase Pin-like site-specific DNA recombinase